MHPRPLLRGDPAQVGPYRVAGRLGEGGQGVVYLGRTADGEHVAIKLLAHVPDEQGRARFATEIELARRVKPFCTASVLDVGELDGVPYVVSEYVDGPSLARVIAERGPLRPAEVRRMAIGCLTALAAIHQAGVVHRDFKPGNVLLARDGPRVIDFGISRALDAADADEHLEGTPPYMAPEQFSGVAAGPPADLFAWAATVVCAATGTPPFGSGDMAAVITRILSAEPQLGQMRGDLRELVSRCLAKDPAARPTASRALLTLLGQRAGQPAGERTLLDEGRRSAAPPPAPRQAPAEPPVEPPAQALPPPLTPPSPLPPASQDPPGSRGRRVLVGAAAAAVLLAGAATAVTLHRANTTAGPTTTTPAGTPAGTREPAPPAARMAPMAAVSTTKTKVPGTRITLHENPADPSWASAVHGDYGDAYTAHVRDPKTGEFRYYGSFHMPRVSPGGAYVVSVSTTATLRTDYNTIRLVTRATGEDVELRVAGKPGLTANPVWDQAGRRVLMTLQADGTNESAGFVIVDAAAKSAREHRADTGGTSGYQWGPEPSTLLRQDRDGTISVVGLDGTVIRSFKDKGTLLAGGAVMALGKIFATRCPDDPTDVCLWDAATGARRSVIPLDRNTAFNGWMDERHFLATVTGSPTTRVVLAGLDGRTRRVLAEAPAKELDGIVISYSAKTT